MGQPAGAPGRLHPKAGHPRRGITAPGQDGDARGADSGNVVTEQAEKDNPPADGHVRLYHAGSDPAEGGYFRQVPRGEVFDGMFALKRGWGAYGTGARYFADIEEGKILTQHDLDYELDYELVKAALKKSMPWLSSDDVDAAWTAVIEDKSEDIEDLERIMRKQNVSEASWEAQRIRGRVAKELGYQAVEMDDENGRSFLIVDGVPLTRVVGNDQSAPDSMGARLSRAAVAGSAPAKTATERAEAIIQNAAGTPKPLDAAARLLTRVTGIEKIARVFYDKGGAP